MIEKLLELLQIKKTTTSPYQAEVCNKTIADYLKKQINMDTLDMAAIKFAYNTSIHTAVKTSPFQLPFDVDPRAIANPTLDIKMQYGEDFGTELYQRMKSCHQMSKDVTISNTDEAIKNRSPLAIQKSSQ